MHTHRKTFGCCLILIVNFSLHVAECTVRYDPNRFWTEPNVLDNISEALIVSYHTTPSLSEEEQLVVRQAMELMEEDKVGMEKAKVLLENAAANNKSAIFYQFIGTIYAQQNKQEEAIHWYQKTMESYPRFPTVIRNLGIMLASNGDFEEAIPHLINAIEIGINDDVVHGLLGLCYFNTQNLLRAETAYRKATLLKPSVNDWQTGLAQVLVQQGKHREGIAVLQELLVSDPDNAVVWLLQCNSYVALGHLGDAIAILEIVDRLEQATPEALELMGQIYVDSKLYKRASYAFEKALAISEESDISNCIYIAKLLLGHGSLDEANSYIEKVRGKFSNTFSREQATEILRLESQIALTTGSSESFVPILEKLVEADPKDHKALLMLGEYYSKLGTKAAYETSDLHFENARNIPELNPQDLAPILIAFAHSYIARERFQRAIELLEEANTIYPQPHMTRYIRQVREYYRASLGL